MIQLATDPNASRSAWRPADPQAKGNPLAGRGRNGHAWPFISRHDARPTAPQDSKRATNSQGGS